MAKNEPDDLGKDVNNYAKYSSIGFQMIVIIGVMAFAGYKIDQSAGHATMWVTAILSLLGVVIAMYLVIRSLKN